MVRTRPRVVFVRRRRGIDLQTRFPYPESRDLEEHLRRGGFPTRALVMNPMPLSPERIREFLLVVYGIGIATVPALIANLLSWAITKRKELRASGGGYRYRVTISGDPTGLVISIDKNGVKIAGQVPTATPPKGVVSRPPRLDRLKREADRRRKKKRKPKGRKAKPTKANRARKVVLIE